MLVIPEKWPRKAERQRIFAALRVLGVQMPLLYVPIGAHMVGRTILSFNRPATAADVGMLTYMRFEDMSTHQQKKRWSWFRKLAMSRMPSGTYSNSTST